MSLQDLITRLYRCRKCDYDYNLDQLLMYLDNMTDACKEGFTEGYTKYLKYENIHYCEKDVEHKAEKYARYQIAKQLKKAVIRNFDSF